MAIEKQTADAFYDTIINRMIGAADFDKQTADTFSRFIVPVVNPSDDPEGKNIVRTRLTEDKNTMVRMLLQCTINFLLTGDQICTGDRCTFASQRRVPHDSDWVVPASDLTGFVIGALMDDDGKILEEYLVLKCDDKNEVHIVHCSGYRRVPNQDQARVSLTFVQGKQMLLDCSLFMSSAPERRSSKRVRENKEVAERSKILEPDRDAFEEQSGESTDEGEVDLQSQDDLDELDDDDESEVVEVTPPKDRRGNGQFKKKKRNGQFSQSGKASGGSGKAGSAGPTPNDPKGKSDKKKKRAKETPEANSSKKLAKIAKSSKKGKNKDKRMNDKKDEALSGPINDTKDKVLSGPKAHEQKSVPWAELQTQLRSLSDALDKSIPVMEQNILTALSDHKPQPRPQEMDLATMKQHVKDALDKVLLLGSPKKKGRHGTVGVLPQITEGQNSLQRALAGLETSIGDHNLDTREMKQKINDCITQLSAMGERMLVVQTGVAKMGGAGRNKKRLRLLDENVTSIQCILAAQEENRSTQQILTGFQASFMQKMGEQNDHARKEMESMKKELEDSKRSNEMAVLTQTITTMLAKQKTAIVTANLEHTTKWAQFANQNSIVETQALKHYIRGTADANRGSFCSQLLMTTRDHTQENASEARSTPEPRQIQSPPVLPPVPPKPEFTQLQVNQQLQQHQPMEQQLQIQQLQHLQQQALLQQVNSIQRQSPRLNLSGLFGNMQGQTAQVIYAITHMCTRVSSPAIIETHTPIQRETHTYNIHTNTNTPADGHAELPDANSSSASSERSAGHFLR